MVTDLTSDKNVHNLYLYKKTINSFGGFSDR